MTTIIIIVVVALVFFVTICVVTFMVWKREAEMRTDSIKAIENSLGEMLDGLTGDQAASARNQSEKKETPYDNVLQEMQNMQQEIGDKIKKESDSKAIRQKDRDPFSWVKMEKADKQQEAHAGVNAGTAAINAAATDITPSVNAAAMDAGAVPTRDVPKAAPANAGVSARENTNISADTANTIAAYTTGTNAYAAADANVQAEHYDDLTVFKPVETRPRGLKWVEVFAEKPGELFKKRRRAHAEELPEKVESPPQETEDLPDNEDALDAAELPEKVSPPSAGEIRLDDAEALLEEAEAFLEKKMPSKQETRKIQRQDTEGGPQAFEEPDELWDLDEEEPDLWDFDELTGQLPEESWQEEPADTYERIETERLSGLEAAEIAEERAEDGVTAEETAETAGDKQAAPDAEAPDSEIDEFLNELMNMPVTGDASPEQKAEPAGMDFAKAVGMEGLDEIYQFDHPSKPPTGYNIGRSGKEYTVSELEMLIKE